MKSTRKNRFKREKAIRRARLRGGLVFTARAVFAIAALAAVSAGFIFVYDGFVQSRQFRVNHIEVSGTRRLDRQRVLTLAEVGPETNILALNLATARKRLLADPWIVDAAVSREIPSGLRISIREEQPLALLEMDDGKGFLINAAGRVFKRADGLDREALPRIQGLRYGDLPVSGKPDTEAFLAVMRLLHLSRENSAVLAYAGLRRILMDREIGATVYSGEDDRAIKLGFGHYREKVAALKHLMARMKGDDRLARCRVIDLYDVSRIVITPAPVG